MSDKLRAAAQAALSAMDYMLRNGEWYCAEERANALRAALAEPEQEYICKCGLRVVPHQCKTGKEF